jgi:hypothetical protein
MIGIIDILDASYQIRMCYFSAKQAAFRIKSKQLPITMKVASSNSAATLCDKICQ